AHVQGAGQGSEHHGYRRQGNPDASARRFARRIFYSAQISAFRCQSAEASAVSSVRMQFLIAIFIDVDLRWWKCRCHKARFSALSLFSAVLVLLRSLSGSFWRGLHQVVARGALHSVLIRIVINDRMYAAEVIEWRRRRGRGPLERSRLPRVRWSLGSFKATVDQ